jgi:hypothetical protein
MPDTADDQHHPKNLWRRFKRIVYLNVFYLACLAVYQVTFYLATQMALYMLGEERQDYWIIAQAVDYARIGLALLSIAGIFVQGALGVWAQFQIDRRLSKEKDEL